MVAAPPPVAQLRAIAQHAAVANGDRHPTEVRFAATLRSDASAIFGSSANIDGRVYVIAMHGHFVVRSWHGPAGSHPPRGNTLVLVVGRKTLRDLDFAVGRDLPLGRVRGWRPLN